VQQNSANSNKGSDSTMLVRNDPPNIWRSLVQFDVSPIPGSATVTSATLTLCLTNNPGGSAVGHIHELYAITDPWTEAGVTWNNQPAYVSGVSAPVTVPSTQQCFVMDVTADVQAWVSGGTNNGWLLKDQVETGSGDSQVKYGTRENNTAGDRPRLDVTFTP
jgi:hypothetical protein